jgi:hypothetical protein
MLRMWWYWKGDNPDPNVVAFMNKNYPSDWTYADFASQFHAELYGKYRSFYSLERQTILPLFQIQTNGPIYLQLPVLSTFAFFVLMIILFFFHLDILSSLARLSCL